MERLSAEDRFVLWPEQVWPQEIGALVILDGHALPIPSMRTSGNKVNRGHPSTSEGLCRTMAVARGLCGCCRFLLPTGSGQLTLKH